MNVFEILRFYIYIFSTPLLTLLLVSIIVWLLVRLFYKHVLHKNISKTKSFVVVSGIVFIGSGFAYLAFSSLEENNWQNIQEACAEQAGYASPSDDNNPAIATDSSQSSYGKCIYNTKRR